MRLHGSVRWCERAGGVVEVPHRVRDNAWLCREELDVTALARKGRAAGRALGVPQMMSECSLGSIISVTPPTS